MQSGKHSEVTANRLSIFTSADKKEANLFGRLYKPEFQKLNPSVLSVYSPSSPKETVVYSLFKDATASKENFKSTSINQQFGPSWSTHWFYLEFEVPKEWKGEEIHLLWDCESEALLYDLNGKPLQAFLGSNGEDRRAEYIISDSISGGEKLKFYVEMSCTAMFGNGKGNGWGGFGPSPTDLDKKFTLKQAEVAVFDRLAYETLQEFVILHDLVKLLPKESLRRAQALTIANKAMNLFDYSNRNTWQNVRKEMSNFFSVKNSESQHRISAVGHCHIDTAWLWPYSETMRKCARSWANQLRIAERHPDYVFGCSQAQQFEWVQRDYPLLYQEIKESVKKGQFVPLGGTWVEMDCNLPNGESFCRQFLYGQRFFKQEFGKQCVEFWLPDTFGYSAQLPQIIKESEIKYFVTQKLSWAQFNKFPHQTFYWEGLDGTRVLTHFPPTDTYNAQANVKDTLFHLENFKEKERSNESLMVFGHGDGGGGPLMSMVENLEKMKNVDGLPIVEMRSPELFFDRLLKDAEDLAVWSGELYFEYHRGTYTSQANNKLWNRRSEFLLRDIELTSVLASLKSKDFKYPTQELDRIWKLVLLNQFHDVIPGSSINAVYRDSDAHYSDILTSGKQLLNSSLHSLSSPSSSPLLFNSLGWNRTEVIEVENSQDSPQKTEDGKGLYVVSVPSLSSRTLFDAQEKNLGGGASAKKEGNDFQLENEQVKATFNSQGKLVSLIDKRNGNRQVIEPNKLGNQFVMYEDLPMYWDAWDVDVYHLEKREDIHGSQVNIIENGPIRASIRFTLRISEKSVLIQTVSLNCSSPRLDFQNEIDWHETHKFLKVEFPLQIRSLRATYESQYGFIERPTHWNTSWDVAKFEVCAHKWADLSDSRYGVALLNDSKYGYATHGNVLRLSLLRSPKSPDPECDMGHHSFRYSLLPHAGSFQEAGVIREGYNFNVPLVRSSGVSFQNESLFTLDNESIVLDAVKKAEDSSDIVVRLYESFGCYGSFTLSSLLPFKSVERVNILENVSSEHPKAELKEGRVTVDVKPFQLITLKFKL
eukprot:TRINITY_DN2801_c1_g1_i1.p1 TRINITY_DN2801_c1_g1~~TRINITY_DN2801_c1_g1_i1.p1  ORF type:complete len:1044 (-),score=436.54 TRINITY_DN2801_c1_g1_i1:183-3314(-)